MLKQPESICKCSTFVRVVSSTAVRPIPTVLLTHFFDRPPKLGNRHAAGFVPMDDPMTVRTERRYVSQGVARGRAHRPTLMQEQRLEVVDLD